MVTVDSFHPLSRLGAWLKVIVLLLPGRYSFDLSVQVWCPNENFLGSIVYDYTDNALSLSDHLHNALRFEEARVILQDALLVLDYADANTDRDTKRATLLNNLSIRLADLGLHEEALQTIQECVALRRALEAWKTGHFTEDLASALCNLSDELGELCRWEEALVTSEESVRLLRSLVAQDPVRDKRSLAVCLNNLY